MNKPYIDDLLKKTDSKYSLVIVAARRARQIVDGEPLLIEVDEFSNKPVTIALNEIIQDKITIVREV